MDLKESKAYNFLKRPVAIGFVAVGLFCVCLSTVVTAQRAGGDEPSRFMERIDQAEGVKRMASFRSQRLAGDYCFLFELEHLPRRGNKETYSGMMWGSWNELGPVTRIQLFTRGSHVAGVGEGSIELIIQNGLEPKVWSRASENEAFKKIEGAALFEPILTSVVYTPFDLQMPFIYWDKFLYEGPGRVQSRVAQQFLMMPPEDSAAHEQGIQSVRIGLDDAYDALLRVEILGAADEKLSRFTVESFKKVQEQYIVKEVTLKNYTSKDRTRFKVKSASVGLVLDKKIFSACHSMKPEVIPDTSFKEL